MHYHNCYVPENGTSLNNVGPSPCQRDNTPPCWMPFLITLIRSKGELKESFSNNKTRNKAAIWSFIASMILSNVLTHTTTSQIAVNALLTHTYWVLFLCTGTKITSWLLMYAGTGHTKQANSAAKLVCSSGISYSEHNINLQTYKMVRYVQQKTAMSLLAKNIINMLNKHLQTQT